MNRDPLTYRYPRTSIQAFGYDAQEAIAMQVFRPNVFARTLRALMDYGWLVAVLCALAGLALYADAGEVDKAVAEEAGHAIAEVKAQLKLERAELVRLKQGSEGKIQAKE